MMTLCPGILAGSRTEVPLPGARPPTTFSKVKAELFLAGEVSILGFGADMIH